MAATDIERGLSTAEVEERIAAGKINRNMELKTKSVKELIIENLCTLFNLINVILAFLVILTGSFKNLTFLFVVFLNTAIGVIQSMRSKKMVDKLTLLTSKKAIAVRDGAEVELDLDQIVLDDIIRLGRGDQIPADAVVVSGEALVNESLLTGESDLIKKQPGSELMSGSFIDSGLLRARVIHVGADNYVAKINNEAKYVKKVNSEIMNVLNAIVRFASIIMIPLGLALFASSVSELWDAAGTPGDSALSWCFSELLAGHVPSSALLSTVGALLGMIPQGLVLLTSSVLAIATVRLARRKVLAQQLYCIETLARVDVLCLDKTGTITSGRMEVEGTYPLPVEGVSLGAGSDEAAVPVDTTVLDFALANVARATSADANETCQALLNYYADRPVEVSEPLSVIPFSSSKKWSGASFAQGSYVMGAAQFVLSDRVFAQVENRVAELADTCRVLVVARVDGFTPDGDMVGEAEPVGFVTIRDEIRTSAAETIGYFNEQGVTLNVISGDDPRTVSSIARVVGVPGADAYVDATTLDTPAKLDAAVDRYHVFGRVTPQQKRELVQALKRREHTVAMTGDGVNDVLALKEADCSVAMAAGSDAARSQADFLKRHLASSIVRDFEYLRLVGFGGKPWVTLGQSYGGFLTLSYLSLFPEGIAASFTCGGIPHVPASASEVYAHTFPRMAAKTQQYYDRYPADVDRVAALADALEAQKPVLPDGSPMTVERLQLMGSDFGMKPSFERMHWIIDHAFVDGDGTLTCGSSVSDSFLMRAFERTNTRTNPLYWTLQEFIYADGDTMPIGWAAAEEKAHRAEFDTLARPLMFTGEAMFPWMFEQMPELKPFKPAMDLLMEDTSWDKIYDPQRLACNEVPLQAAVYFDDMYVDSGLQLDTLSRVGNSHAWVTNEFEHDGLHGGVVFKHLFDEALNRGDLRRIF